MTQISILDAACFIFLPPGEVSNDGILWRM